MEIPGLRCLHLSARRCISLAILIAGGFRKDAKIYGRSPKNGDPEIIGKIVEIGGEIYR